MNDEAAKPNTLSNLLRFVAAFVPGLAAGAAGTFAVDLLPKAWTKINVVVCIWSGTALLCFIAAVVAGLLLKRWGWSGFFAGAALVPPVVLLMFYVLGSAVVG